MPTTIAIAGISSKLALLVTKALLQRPDVHIRGSCRDIKKLPDSLSSSSRVSLVQSGTYDRDTLRDLVRGCDVVVCCYYASSEVMLEAQKLLIDLCEEEGVNRYIASDYTIDYDKLDRGDLVVKNFAKDVKAYMDSKSTVKGVHVLIGIFMETFLELFGVWKPETNEVAYWGTGNEKWDVTSYQTGAEYIAAVALDSNAAGFLKFRGDHKSAVEIADDVGTVYGTRPTLKCNGSLADIAETLDGVGNAENVQKAAAYFVLSGKIAFGEDIDNEKYPFVKPEPLIEMLRQHQK